MNILFTISGEGRRFAEAGYKTPKPLIEVLGRKMIEWGADSCNFLDRLEKGKIIFTVRKEHLEQFFIEEELKKIYGESIVIVPVDSQFWPKGQAGHALAAKEHIDNDSRLFIFSCDTFSPSAVAEMIEDEDPDGIIPCFISCDPKFSYAKLDENGYVSETAEKKVISNLATAGHYYFKHGADFIESVKAMQVTGLTFNGEYYVAPCYNYLIQKKKKVKIILVSENWVLGTPEELDYFLKNYLK